MVFGAFVVIGIVLFTSYKILKKIHTRLEARVFQELLRETYLFNEGPYLERGGGDYIPIDPDILFRDFLDEPIKIRERLDERGIKRTISCIELPTVERIYLKRELSEL
ncbi:unnamed protein product [Psylliodes chrysocephalus]|uniref:Uncharacterized protein n=1 Tax=Psylliodes chrysocephalus TaxID=3402493 RepID=A0A9P0CNK9_9CUCU|nr:unnamed protein product [Psylliodes chrysocephala]